MAYELTEKALVRPECRNYQPHIKHEASSASQGIDKSPTAFNHPERSIESTSNSMGVDAQAKPPTLWQAVLNKMLTTPTHPLDNAKTKQYTNRDYPEKSTSTLHNNPTSTKDTGTNSSHSQSVSHDCNSNVVTFPRSKSQHIEFTKGSNYINNSTARELGQSTLRDPKLASNQLRLPNLADPSALALKSKTRRMVKPKITSNRGFASADDHVAAPPLPRTATFSPKTDTNRPIENTSQAKKSQPNSAHIINHHSSQPSKDNIEGTLSLRRVSSTSSSSSSDSQASFSSTSTMYDSDGDPLVGATMLDGPTIEKIHSTFKSSSSPPSDNKYILNTVRTVFSSPRALAASFQLETQVRFRSASPSKALNINVAQALSFAHSWLHPHGEPLTRPNKHGSTDVYSTFISAVSIALHRLEALPIFNVGAPDTTLWLNSEVCGIMLEDACRVLGLLFLLLAPGVVDNVNIPTSAMRSSRSRVFIHVATLIGKIVLPLQPTQGVQGSSPELPSYTIALITKRMTWLKRHWIHFFSILPAEIIREWYNIIVDQVTRLARGSYSPMLSERACARRITSSSYPFIPLLEFLRLLYEGNEVTLNGVLSRMPYPSVDSNTENDISLNRQDFVSSKFIACFRIEEEMNRWLRHARFQTNPDKEACRIDPVVEANFFTPFIYPFLIPTSVKAQILLVETHTRLKNRYMTAFDRQAEVAQNQRLLHVDLYAEQVVRPNVDPTWEYPENHAEAIRASANPYLVLAIRRTHIVQDTMDLMRNNMHRLRYPFKVRFIAGGEDGVDLGGVQKEFFRLLLPKLLSPDTGLFVFADYDVDADNQNPDQETTRVTNYLWPNGASPHSLTDFEVVGGLFGIAFTNGITLGEDIAPLAPFLLAQLTADWTGADDWSADVLMKRMESTFPSLISGFRQLLEWSEDEHDGAGVEDVFCRSFDITVADPLKIAYRRFSGSKGPLGPSSIASDSDDNVPSASRTSDIRIEVENYTGYTNIPLIPNGSNIEVTATNRKAYIRRYLQFIGDKYVHDIVVALRTGFQRATDGVAYRMLHADELRLLLCGQNTPIDIDQLEEVATYEDFAPHHPVIRMFWKVVRSLTPVQHRMLLKFVMASDRIPLGGISSLTFVIQRNGPDSERLPTALTCFSRLLLPAYNKEEKMRYCLITAIENADGFGLV